MSKFGWSYPAGCEGTPYDHCPDDSACACCGATLPPIPDEVDPEDPVWNGFCDEECRRKYAEDRQSSQP